MGAAGLRRIAALAALLVPLLLAAGCATRLVQPYDEQLQGDTEALFKSASAMIDDGLVKSPRTDADRAAIQARFAAQNKPLSDHPGHVAQFEARYNQLAIDADALILRALVNSQEIGVVGNKLQKKIETLIDQAIPSACPEQDAEFDALSASLTVRNYLDLKCLLVRWKAQHADDTLTGSTGILKRTNWELRRSTLFAAVLAVESAEASKRK